MLRVSPGRDAVIPAPPVPTRFDASRDCVSADGGGGGGRVRDDGMSLPKLASFFLSRVALFAQQGRSRPALTCHYRIEPSGKEASLLEHPDQGYEMSSYITPMIPCLFTDVIGHSIQLARGAIRRCPAMLPRPLSSAAGVCSLSRRLFLKVVRLEVDLLQAVPRPILAEVHPRKIGILPVVVDDPQASKFTRSLKNMRRRAILRRCWNAPRHTPGWRPGRRDTCPASDALISLSYQDPVPIWMTPRRMVRVPSLTREGPHCLPRPENAHQMEAPSSSA